MKTKSNTKADVNNSSKRSSSYCPVCKKPGDKSCQGCHAVSYCSSEHQRDHWNSHKPNCSPFILKENETLGRHLVAARKLRPGLYLVEESPLISGGRVKNENTNGKFADCPAPICLSCFKIIRKNNINNCVCSKCKWPVCGVACAKAIQHAENECTHFMKNRIKYNGSIIPQSILYRGIMILRGLLKKNQGNPKWVAMMDLQQERVDKSDVFNLKPEIILKLKIYFKIQKLATDEEWNRLNNVIEINAYSIERVEKENEEPSHATILFHISSLIAHSCTPNCTWSVSYSPNFSMRVRTSKEIKKGEVLTVSYNQSWNYYGTHRRRSLISETAGFICKCDRCNDSTELGTFASGIKCKSGNCLGYLLPINSATIIYDESLWKCDAVECNNILPGILVNSKIVTLENELSELQMIYMTVPMAGMKLFEDFIENNREKVLHKNHWILQQARRIIVNIHGSQLRCLQWDQLENFISHCSNLLLIWDILAPGISNERGLHQMQLSRALNLQFEIKSEKLSNMGTSDKFKYLKKIHVLQSNALLYWNDDIQTKPLDKEFGFEANCLQMEILHTIKQLSALS